MFFIVGERDQFFHSIQFLLALPPYSSLAPSSRTTRACLPPPPKKRTLLPPSLPAQIEFLWRAKQPYNVSAASEVAALAALSNPGYLQRVRDALVSERDRLFSELQSVPFLEPYPSHANFVLCKVRACARHFGGRRRGS
eukprot:352232-Chlamydomonas_euryale.AAC.2